MSRSFPFSSLLCFSHTFGQSSLLVRKKPFPGCCPCLPICPCPFFPVPFSFSSRRISFPPRCVLVSLCFYCSNSFPSSWNSSRNFPFNKIAPLPLPLSHERENFSKSQFHHVGIFPEERNGRLRPILETMMLYFQLSIKA